MVREWRHLRLLKRMARGHHIDGISSTQPGECTVLCPACPHPGKNLPDDYASAGPDKSFVPPTVHGGIHIFILAPFSWLYALFIAVDANFRLKRLDVSNEAKDPGLNLGYAYVVAETEYKQFLGDFDSLLPNDDSTCNNHDAIKSAHVRGGKGYAATGVGAVDCSRHDMKRPVAVGDLQKGERYVFRFLTPMHSHHTIQIHQHGLRMSFDPSAKRADTRERFL